MLKCRARAEVIVTFIALLELVKLGHITVTQARAVRRHPDRRPHPGRK
jgi:chromatin segregation and condensation protein Rec8/ScpA/Scc1 (kleisin family)